MRLGWFSSFALLALAACSFEEADFGRLADAATTNPNAADDPPAQERADVIATLQGFFDALELGDDALLRSVVDPSVVMHSSQTRDGDTTLGQPSLDGLASRIVSSDVPLIERMWDPVVLVDGAMATIWAPYDFYAGSTFSHCGVDAANLMRRDDGWKIVSLSWTLLQPPACQLHPDGPPAYSEPIQER